MRILITNLRLNSRGGTESFVRDLTRNLQASGHTVMAYSSDLRQGERFLESDLVPVTSDLDKLPFKPDIIHAQHHLDAMTALMALPGVPALYHCHGATWPECSPTHPRILHYLAVSRTLAERMAAESNIPLSKITLLANGVDLRRFSEVRQPPAKPRRALFYGRSHRQNAATIQAVTDAAAHCGLALDFLGGPSGVVVDRPEEALLRYDVVFASGVSAIEALACGCAVVVLGRGSCGEWVHSDNFERYRQVNFSAAANLPPPTREKVEAELRRYSASECACVSARLREEADFSLVAKKLENLYQQIITQHQSMPRDHDAESIAIAHYLRRLVPVIKLTDETLKNEGAPIEVMSSLDRMQEDMASFQRQLATLQQNLGNLAKLRSSS